MASHKACFLTSFTHAVLRLLFWRTCLSVCSCVVWSRVFCQTLWKEKMETENIRWEICSPGILSGTPVQPHVNQPIIWQRLNALRHVDMAEINRALEWGTKVI